ncbi:MAG: hypothetical protein V7K41_07780 [Nostoc sp.]
MLPFRLLCQVARAVVARSQLRITIHQAFQSGFRYRARSQFQFFSS